MLFDHANVLLAHATGEGAIIPITGKDCDMGHDRSVNQEIRNSSSQEKKGLPKQATQPSDGTGWMFPLLMIVIGLGILGIMLKSFGLF